MHGSPPSNSIDRRSRHCRATPNSLLPAALVSCPSRRRNTLCRAARSPCRRPVSSWTTSSCSAPARITLGREGKRDADAELETVQNGEAHDETHSGQEPARLHRNVSSAYPLLRQSGVEIVGTPRPRAATWDSPTAKNIRPSKTANPSMAGRANAAQMLPSGARMPIVVQWSRMTPVLCSRSGKSAWRMTTAIPARFQPYSDKSAWT